MVGIDATIHFTQHAQNMIHDTWTDDNKDFFLFLRN